MRKARALKRKELRGDSQGSKSVWLAILKGALIALCISLVGILVFAFIIKFVSISDNAIRPINQVIKGLSILVGTFVALRKSDKMGLVSGMMIGLLYTVIAFVVFSILDMHFSFNLTLLNDIVFGMIMGGICGVIAVNLKKK